MAEYIYDIADPVELTGYVRTAIQDVFPFQDLLPIQQVPDIEYELTQLDHRGGPVARYRGWDVPAQLARRPGVTTITGEIPPLSIAYDLRDKEINQAAALRAALSGEDPRIIKKLLDDAVHAGEGIMNRLSWACAELLTTAQVTLNDATPDVSAANSVKAVFATPPAQLAVSPAGTDWDNHTTSVPLDDLVEWETLFADNNGGLPPEAWIMSKRTRSHLSQNAQVQAQMRNVNAGYNPTPADLEVMADQYGIFGRLVVSDIRLPLMSDDTAAGRAIPENYVIGVRSTALGNTLMAPPSSATTLTIGAPARQVLVSNPGVTVYQVADVNPAKLTTVADAVALPVLRDPSALFVAIPWTPAP